MDNFYLFLLTTLAIVMAPGADALLVTKNTMSSGFKGGLQTSIGVCSGLAVHAVAAVFGLTAIIAKSVFLFQIVKYAGAAYLIYMGISALVSKKQTLVGGKENNTSKQEQRTPTKQRHSYFLQGMLTNILNPKSVLFYFTFIPQFIVPNENTVGQIILFSTTIIILGFLWLTFYAYTLTYIRKWFEKPLVQSVFQKVTGTVLLSLGLKVALEKS